MNAGATFTLDGEDNHLWIIVSDPSLDAQRVVLLNLTSWQHIHDQSCIVQAGEHPWVRHRSLVYYPAPRIMTLEQLERRRSQKLLTFHGDVSPALLEKIRIGAFRSPHIPTGPQDILCEQFPDLADRALD